MAATAQVKLPSSEVVKPTREGGSPLGLPMGRMSIRLRFKSMHGNVALAGTAGLLDSHQMCSPPHPKKRERAWRAIDRPPRSFSLFGVGWGTHLMTIEKP
ncbi:MAG TPA: hypothetical protein VEL31_17225, partial [Ktedonobacteraceae bacterium]|nr:hypothetical protein [Ktedonobacteraceae bacterium]